MVAVILVTPDKDDLTYGAPFTFNDVFNQSLKPRTFDAKWLPDTDAYVYQSREGELMVYDAANNVTELIMDNTTFRQLNTQTYSVSADLKYVLIAYNIVPTYRHSYTAQYIIYDRTATNPKSRVLAFPVTHDGADWAAATGAGAVGDARLTYAEWAPAGHALTFVHEQNLYHQADPFTTPYKLTNTSGAVYNGVPDWLYEEEILGSRIAHWWSPRATSLAFAVFDDTHVPTYQFQRYGPATSIYGDIDTVPYPKAGDAHETGINPEVALYIIHITNPGIKIRVKPPPEFTNREHYFQSLVWRDDTSLLVTWCNRAQNRSIIMVCDASSGDCYRSLTHTSQTGWVEKLTPLLAAGAAAGMDHYLVPLPQQDGDHGYWTHVAMVTVSGEPGVITFLTQGTWDVIQIVAYDPETQYVYFISTNGDARKRHLFRVVSDGRHDTECLTCDFPATCQYISASFSSSAKYYILHCQGPGLPNYQLRSTVDDRNISLEDNAALAARLAHFALPAKRYFEIEVEDGHKLWAQLYLPPQLNMADLTQYPMLVHVYAGPGSQKVTERFSLGWHTFLASSHSVITAAVDGRGAGGRGLALMHAVYKALGTVEVQDQLTGARWMRDNLHYVDKERTGIWGWSYGGFVTAHALADGFLPCGAAVAPVTDWRYYDTAYTERYMGFSGSTDNYRGYDAANVSSKAAKFRGKKFLLVHGTADDNVHFQHSAQLSKALTEAEVPFRMQVYSDKAHAIAGSRTSRHLHRLLTNFFVDECWHGALPRQVKEDGKSNKAA